MANTACWPGALVCQIFFSWSTSPVKGIGRRMAEKEGLESLYKMFTMFLYLECTCPRVEAWHRKDGSHPIHARPRLHSAPFFSLDDDALAAHSLPSDGAARAAARGAGHVRRAVSKWPSHRTDDQASLKEKLDSNLISVHVRWPGCD